MGRRCKYEEYVEPYLEEIKDWARIMTEEQIAKKLGVAYRTFNDYKMRFPPLVQALKKGRQDLVIDLKSTLIERAKGYEYKEKKTIEDSKGYTRTEVMTKHMPADVASINLLLKNYDKDNWSNDPRLDELKREELELKKKKMEEGEW